MKGSGEMNRRDQILQVLGETSESMTTAAIAKVLDTVEQNIHKVLRDLVTDRLVNQVGIKPFTYLLSSAGRDYLSDPSFGQATRAHKAQPQAIDTQPTLKVGVFTSGELQIEVGGKRLSLSREQAADLVQFLDALPNRLFESPPATPDRPSPFAALGVAPGRVHRLADEA